MGKRGHLPLWGGGEKTSENMSNDPMTCVWVRVHVAPRRRAPTRVPTGCEYVCRYAFAYVYAGTRRPFVFKCVCMRTVSGGVGVKLVPTLL